MFSWIDKVSIIQLMVREHSELSYVKKMTKTTIKERKKVCTKCGRKLWLRDFYKDKYGKRYGMCKDCKRRQSKEIYEQKRKRPDGVFYDKKERRLMEHRGLSKRIYWTGDMISLLKRHFHNTKNEELAEMIGVSLRTLAKKANEFGLVKSEAYIRRLQRENVYFVANSYKKGHTPWNKGLKLSKAV